MVRTRATGWKTCTMTLREGEIEVLMLKQPFETVCLPAHPPVARTSQHTPVFSLTLILSDGASSASDEPAISQSLLTLGLTLRLPDEALLVLNAVKGGSHRPLFTHSALFALVYTPPNGHETVLAAQPTGGVNARATLSLLCGRDETLALLKALDNEPNALSIRVYITYPQSATTRTIALSARWRDVRMVLAQVMLPEQSGFISREELQCCFNAMQDTGIIKATIEGDPPADDDLFQADLFALFSRNIAPILTPTKSVDDEGRVVEGFVLKRQYLDETMALNCRQVITAPEEHLLELNAPLQQVLGGVLDGLSRDQFISAVHYPSGRVLTVHPSDRSRSDEGCYAMR